MKLTTVGDKKQPAKWAKANAGLLVENENIAIKESMSVDK